MKVPRYYNEISEQEQQSWGRLSSLPGDRSAWNWLAGKPAPQGNFVVVGMLRKALLD